jgi:hypothetical protein
MCDVIEDRKMLQESFSRIAGVLETAADQGAEEMVLGLCKIMNELTKLRHAMYRVQDMGDVPEGAVGDNTMGTKVMAARFKELANDIRTSIEDLSWVEDLETFGKTQRETAQMLYDTINSEDASETDKLSAMASLQLVAPFTPAEDAPEWLVRKHRTDHLLLGIEKSVTSCLIDTAKL